MSKVRGTGRSKIGQSKNLLHSACMLIGIWLALPWAAPVLAAHKSPNERLLQAATSGNVSELQAALRDGAQTGVADRTRDSPPPQLPLVAAVIGRHYVAAKALLNAGADPNTAIGIVACTSPNIVQLLLEHGANPNYQYSDSSGPLAGTVLRTSESDRAADRYPKAEDGCFKSAELLIRYGANVNGIEGVPSPLFVAIDLNSVRFAKLFISKGAKTAEGNKHSNP
ncbi:MAG: ankyrin repeat domain-containing protein [Candidatus Micrarchaeaceae archaeon]